MNTWPAYERRKRPIRMMESVALVVLAALILWTYVSKASGAQERAEIHAVETQIAEERARIRVLRAEVAHLEQPARLEALAREHLGMEPAPLEVELGEAAP